MLVENLEHQQLKEWIDDASKVSGKEYLVVDVRDDDFKNGHIPGCLNIPAHVFLNDPMAYKELASANNIVFHCAMSQVRGPKCAKRFAAISGRDVYILRGGFQVWQEFYKNDLKYVVDHNQAFWDDPY